MDDPKALDIRKYSKARIHHLVELRKLKLRVKASFNDNHWSFFLRWIINDYADP
jgi:hypothetical protein